MTRPSIGFICGSLRTGSINAKLTQALSARVEAAGALVRHLDLGSYDLPIFHGDLETPDGVGRLKSDMLSCGGLIIVTPEYNGSLPPLLKNAIDWVSTTGTEQFTQPVYGIASCTPGAMSGIMVLRELNYILNRIGAEVVLPHVGTHAASGALDENDILSEPPSNERANEMIAKLLERVGAKG